MKIAYLGPEASFTSLVAKQLFPNELLEPRTNIRDCFIAIKDKTVDLAVVPLENSIEGTVSMTLDYLYEFQDVLINAEAILPISHHLMLHPSQTEFNKILSHPQALAQCFHFLEKNYKDAIRQDYHSTAASAKFISENMHEKTAAIANNYAAKLYGLKIIHENIHDFEQNHTKFVVIGLENKALGFSVSIKTKKTSIIFTLPIDHPGGLHQALSVFAWRNMNLTKIESRTLKTGLGSYFFFINIDGLWDKIHSVNAMEELKSIGAEVRYVGYYNEYLLDF